MSDNGSSVALKAGVRDRSLWDGLRNCRSTDVQGRSTMSLPPLVYTSEAALDHERRAIFGLGWVGIGRSDRWSEPGTYSAMDLAGEPLIVVRDQDSALRAYSNSCRHRGSQIVEGTGTCSIMRCPFHAWTYGLDGRLLGAPSMHQTDGFDKADHGLHEHETAERSGFAFVSLDPSPPAIDVWLGDFADLHAPWPLADLVMTRRREFVVDCNWKLFAEVFNEYYHLPVVHADSIDDTYLKPDAPERAIGAFASQFGATTATGGLLASAAAQVLPPLPELTGREANGVRYSWLFPNVMVALGTDAIWGYEVYPLTADRSLCAQFVCFPSATIDRHDFAEKAESYYERFDVAIDEDIPALERQHRGLCSAHAAQGPFSYLEPSVARFAGWYADRMLGVAS